jgi:hypothetical protein
MKIEGSGSASGSRSISQRHGSADPDPHQNVTGPEHCLSVRFFSVDGVLLARFFFIDKVLSKVFFSGERALLARLSVDGLLLLMRFSVEGVPVDPALLIIVAGVLSVELFTDIRSIHSGWSGSFRLLLSSVPDPDPHVFPNVFWLPGSGSISQRYGSGSGYFYHHAKTVRKKNLDSYCFVTYYGLLSLKNDVNVPSKNASQKNFFLNISFLLAS